MKMDAPLEGKFILGFIVLFGGLCFLIFLFKVGYYLSIGADHWLHTVFGPFIG